MANKYHFPMHQNMTAPTSPKERQGVKPPPLKESTHSWAPVPGPKGKRRNAVGFQEVKVSAKQDMADDGVPTVIFGDEHYDRTLEGAGPRNPDYRPETVTRLSLESFNNLPPDLQERYIETVSRAPDPVLLERFMNRDPRGRLTKEMIDEQVLRPYRDVLRTGLPLSYGEPASPGTMRHPRRKRR